MDHDIHTKFEWSLQVRRHKCVVANNASSNAMSNVANGLQISHDHYRVCRCFQNHHLGILFYRSFYVEWIRSVDEIKLEVVVRKNLCEESRCPTIGIVRDDYMFASFDEFQRGINRRHS